MPDKFIIPNNPTVAPLPGAGGNVPNPPPLPGSQPQPTPPAIPAFWNGFYEVNKRLLEIWNTDPVRAQELLTEFKAKMGG